MSSHSGKVDLLVEFQQTRKCLIKTSLDIQYPVQSTIMKEMRSTDISCSEYLVFSVFPYFQLFNLIQLVSARQIHYYKETYKDSVMVKGPFDMAQVVTDTCCCHKSEGKHVLKYESKQMFVRIFETRLNRW